MGEGRDAIEAIHAVIGAGLALRTLPTATPADLAAARDALARWTSDARRALRLAALDNVLAREFSYLGPLRAEVAHDGSHAADVRLLEGELRAKLAYLADLQARLLARPRRTRSA